MPKTELSRPSQKGYISGRSSDAGAIALAQEAIEQALILHPKIPAAQLADVLIEERGAEVAAQLGTALSRIFYTRGLLSARRKESAANRKQLLLPGFEHLPLKITVANGKRIRLLSANREGVRSYYWSLMKKHSERKRNDPKIIEAKALLDEMTKRARTEKGITVREVILEA